MPNPLPVFDVTVYGHSFVFTGTLKTMTRMEALALCAANGGYYNDDVTQETDYVVVGFQPGQKLLKANKMGCKVIYESDFLKACHIKLPPKTDSVNRSKEPSDEDKAMFAALHPATVKAMENAKLAKGELDALKKTLPNILSPKKQVGKTAPKEVKMMKPLKLLHGVKGSSGPAFPPLTPTPVEQAVPEVKVKPAPGKRAFGKDL